MCHVQTRRERGCLAGLNRTLGLSDELFVLVDSVLLTGLGRVMLMPSLVLAARICPEVRPHHSKGKIVAAGHNKSDWHAVAEVWPGLCALDHSIESISHVH